MGKALGTGAAMESLLRTRVGQFTLQEARTLDELERIAKTEPGQLLPLIRPVDSFFVDLPAASCSPEALRLLKNGNTLTTDEFRFLTAEEDPRKDFRAVENDKIIEEAAENANDAADNASGKGQSGDNESEDDSDNSDDDSDASDNNGSKSNKGDKDNKQKGKGGDAGDNDSDENDSDDSDSKGSKSSKGGKSGKPSDNSDEDGDTDDMDLADDDEDDSEDPFKDPFADEEDIPQLNIGSPNGKEPREATIKDIIKQINKLEGEAKRGAIQGLKDLINSRKPKEESLKLTEAKKGVRDMTDDEFGDLINDT
jgi:hypothetical protein